MKTHIERLCGHLKEARKIAEQEGMIFDFSFSGPRVHVLKADKFLEVANSRESYISMKDAGPNIILRYRYSCIVNGIEFFTFSERRFDAEDKTAGQYIES